jgi:hypothetical protein
MANQATELTAVLRDGVESEKQERIAALAFEFWLARAFRNGSPETDWLRADRQVRSKAGIVSRRRTTAGLFLVPRRRDPSPAGADTATGLKLFWKDS